MTVQAAAAALTFNYASTILLIFINKLLLARLSVPPVTLAAFHLLATAVVLEVAACIGLLRRPERKLPVTHRASVAALQSGAIVLANASLQLNSLGFYQLAKQLQVPMILLLERLLFGRSVSPRRFWSLAAAVACIVAAVASDVRVTLVGAVVAFSGTLCTSGEVIMWSQFQTGQDWGALQLLNFTMPFAAAFTAAAAVTLELGTEQKLGAVPPATGALIAASCAAALMVNSGTVLVAGKAGALAYALLGLFKTATITVAGTFLFDAKPPARAAAFAVAALCALLVYSLVALEEREREALPPAGSAQSEAPAAADDGLKEVCCVNAEGADLPAAPAASVKGKVP